MRGLREEIAAVWPDSGFILTTATFEEIRVNLSISISKETKQFCAAATNPGADGELKEKTPDAEHPRLQCRARDAQMEHRAVPCAASRHSACCARFSGVKLRWPHRLQICVPSQQRAPNAVSTFGVCFLKLLVAAGQALNAQRNQQMSALHWVLRTTTVEPGQFHGGIVEIERPRAPSLPTCKSNWPS
jgi:hypothetical protein